MDDHASLGLASLVGAVLFNMVASMVPLALLHPLKSGTAGFDELYEGLTSFYFSLLTGALTLSLCVFLVVAFLRRRGARRHPATASSVQWCAVWTFAIAGTLGATALHPARFAHGCAHAAFFPSAVALVLLAWGLLSQAPGGWAAVVCLGMVVEFLGMFWSHVLLASTTRFLDDPNSNWNLKDVQGVVFLHDFIGAGKLVVVVVTVAVQAVLVSRLLRSVWQESPSTNPLGLRPGESRSRPRQSGGMIVAPLS